MSYVTFYSALGSNNIGESPLGLSLIAFFVTLIPLMLMVGMYFSDKQEEINIQNKNITNQQKLCVDKYRNKLN